MVLALGQIGQGLKFSLDECFLLCPRPTLNLFFPLKSRCNVQVFFNIHQLHWQPFLGMVRSPTILMLADTVVQIYRTSGIIASIRTLKYVHVTFHPLFVASTTLSHRSNHILYKFRLRSATVPIIFFINFDYAQPSKYTKQGS